MRSAQDGRTAIITGASSGLGRGLAIALAREGWNVGLVARREEALREVASRVEAEGARASVAPADVGDRVQLREAVTKVEAELGPISLAIANAGWGEVTDPRALDSGRVEQMFRVNFFGMLHLFEPVIPGMIERGQGHLVGVSSLAGIRGLPTAGAYSASKAAMTAFLEAIRGDLRGAGVKVTPILPGYVKTPMTANRTHPMPFLMEEDDAIRLMMRAIRQERRYFAFPWPLNFLLKVGKRLPPVVWDRLAGRARRGRG